MINPTLDELLQKAVLTINETLLWKTSGLVGYQK